MSSADGQGKVIAPTVRKISVQPVSDSLVDFEMQVAIIQFHITFLPFLPIQMRILALQRNTLEIICEE